MRILAGDFYFLLTILGIIMKLLVLFLLLFNQYAFADLYVIAHKSFAQENIELSTLKSIYSGDTQYISDVRVIPLDQDIHSENYEYFYSHVIDKPMSQIISHWSKLIFTGKGQAPISLSGDMSILNFVENNPNAIGYIHSKYSNDKVKVVQKIKLSNYKSLDIKSLKSR